MKPEERNPMRQTQPPPDEVNALIALYNARRYAEAESRARALIGQYPDFGFGWKLLGGALQMQCKDALTAFQKVAELMPDDAEAHYNLGVVLKSSGRLDDATASYRRAVALKPDFAEAHSNLGNVLKELGRLDDAVASYRRALELKPDFAETHNHLGHILQELGQHDASRASHRRAAQLKHNSADAHNNMGFSLQKLGQLDAAIANYRRALELKPDFARAHNNLGIALLERGLFADAANSFRCALQINPDSTRYNNLGIALRELGQLKAAVANYRLALELKPDSVDTHINLGNTLKDLGKHDDALASYRRALELKPDYVLAQTNLLFTMNYTAHAPEYCIEEAQKYGRVVSNKVKSRFSAWQCSVQPKRLRIGIVSGDLYGHPVTYFLESLLAQLDPAYVELIAYPTNFRTDKITARIKSYFTSWKPLTDLNDEDAANLIHADGVHILIDLSGHTGHNRLPVFAWKPAPIQVSWLGYFATTGVAEMDYFLADEVGVPEVQRQQFTESIWYLPDTRLCFTAPVIDLPVTPLPALSNGMITFGCFQNMAKLSDGVLESWGEIFAALPNAKLRVQTYQLDEPAQVEQLLQCLQRYGIDPTRVVTHGSTQRETYLAAHAEVDMILDTFPYPGGTTTCEALWMGVPTLTLAGDSLLARQGASLLTAAGLGDWVATSVADYVDKAVALASDLPKLAALRAGLREQVSASPLFDAKRFARNFEAALWGMWQARTQGNLPTPPEPLTASHD